MKRAIASILVIALVAASLPSCTFFKVNPSVFNGKGGGGPRVKGTGTLSSTTYQVPQFDRIEANLPAEITYMMSEGEPSVEICTSENLLDYLHFKVDDGCLKVMSDNGEKLFCDEMKIILKSGSLNGVTMRGAESFDVPGHLECENLEVIVQGAAEMHYGSVTAAGKVSLLIQGAGEADINGLDCDALSLQIQGAGEVTASGKCNNADLLIQGAGEIDIEDLEADNVSQSIQGAGVISRK